MTTASTIEDLIHSTLGDSASLRERHFLRLSLQNLVRLAQAEQRVEVQASLTKALQPVQPLLPA